jgi:hypothetical protein
MHGGADGSGAPQGARNGNYKHGRYTKEVAATRHANPAEHDARQRRSAIRGGLADRAIGRERHGLGIDGRARHADVQWNYAPRSITSVRSFAPAGGKDQRRLAQQLVCHHLPVLASVTRNGNA